MKLEMTKIVLVSALIMCLSYVPALFIESWFNLTGSLIIGVVGILYYAITLSIIFFGLRIHLNKKYTNSITFWKYALIGLIASVFSIVFYQVGEALLYEYNLSNEFSSLLKEFLNNLMKGIYENIVFVFFISLPLCLIAGGIYKKTKQQVIIDNDSLDANMFEE